jgi:hypothetical protein
MQPPKRRVWADWLEDAHQIIAEWERRRAGAVMPVGDASRLAELIAAHLHGAFTSGLADAELQLELSPTREEDAARGA